MSHFVSLDADGSYCTLDALDLTLASLTLEAWVRTSSTENQVVLAARDAAAGTVLTWSIGNGTIHFDLNPPDVPAVSTTSDACPQLTDGTWHHVAITFTPKFFQDLLHYGDLVRFYVDGQVLSNRPTLPGSGPAFKGLQVRLGAAFDQTRSFKGGIGNIRIWNVSRSDQQVALNTTAVVAPNATGLIGSWPFLGVTTDGKTLDQCNVANQVTRKNLQTGGSATLAFDPAAVLVDALIEVKSNALSAPFPAFAGGEESAYQAVQRGLGLVDDVRSYYTDLAIDFSAQLTNLGRLSKPVSIEQADWDAVTVQLALEFTAVSNVRSYFSNLLSYYTALQAENEASLSYVGQVLAPQPKTPTSGNFFDWFDVIAKVVSVIPKVGKPISIIMNLGKALVTLASSHDGSVSDGSLPFRTEYAQLWADLGDQFPAMVDRAAELETLILQDYGKLSTANTYINQKKIYWGTDTPGALIKAAENGYRMYFTQMLMTSMYSRYNFYSGLWFGSRPCIPCPSYMPYGVQSHSGHGVFPYAVIGQGTQDRIDSVPTDAAVNLVYNVLGAKEADFFSWNWSVIDHDCPGPDDDQGMW